MNVDVLRGNMFMHEKVMVLQQQMIVQTVIWRNGCTPFNLGRSSRRLFFVAKCHVCLSDV